MFLPVPPGLQNMPLHQQIPAPRPAAGAPPPQIFQQHKRDPNEDARVFPAISPADVFRKKAALYNDEKAKLLGNGNASANYTPAWYEDPVALGSLLIMFPPIGLAALWSSKRYSNDARWALTVMTALTMCLAAAIVVAIVALR